MIEDDHSRQPYAIIDGTPEYHIKSCNGNGTQPVMCPCEFFNSAWREDYA